MHSIRRRCAINVFLRCRENWLRNHSLALMLKMCKYSLFESTSTLDLHDDADNPTEACTSRLQTWHRGGGHYCIRTSYGFNCEKTKLSDSEPRREPGLKCLLYEARNNVAVQEAEETRFKDTKGNKS